MPSDKSSDRFVVVCNLVEGDKTAVPGAKVWVSPVNTNVRGRGNRLMVVVRSRGGRHIEKWIGNNRLGYFRVTTLPPEHPRYNDDRIARYDDRDGAQQLADRLQALS